MNAAAFGQENLQQSVAVASPMNQSDDADFDLGFQQRAAEVADADTTEYHDAESYRQFAEEIQRLGADLDGDSDFDML